MSRASQPKRDRILVFRIGHLGDTIVALPGFQAIREAYPDAHIAFLCNAVGGREFKVPSTAALPREGLFDELIGYGVYGGARGAFEKLGLVQRLRKKKFDTVFYLLTRNRTAAQIERDKRFFRLCGIREALCVDHLSNNLLEFPTNAPLAAVQYEGDFILDSLASEGVPVGGGKVEFPLKSGFGDQTAALKWWEDQFMHGERPESFSVLGVGPGSKWPSKVWSEEKYEKTVAQLLALEDHNLFPVVFGGPEDREKGKRLISSWGKGLCAAGSLNVREAAGAMTFCDLYLGNDTGTLHMAAAAGVPCVAVFAAIDYPGRWEPPGSEHRIFRKKVPCEGCHTPDCFNNHLCLEEIGVEEVVSACRRILDEQKG